MTVDPDAPGDPAVFLDREDATDFSSQYISRYARIKILSDDGKIWSHVEISYDPALMLPPTMEGRTIHPDGTISLLPKESSPHQVDDESAIRVQTVAFTLPDVTVGSILEYRWTVRIAPRPFPHARSGANYIPPHYWSPLELIAPRWDIQERVFTHHARFRFDPFTLRDKGDRNVLNVNTWRMGYVDGERADNLIHVDRLPAGAHVALSPTGEYSLEVRDIPALANEPSSPPPASRAYHVQFCFSPYPSPNSYWESEIKRWSSELASDTQVTATLGEGVARSTTAGSIPEEKARQLYAAVQTLNNLDFSQAAKTPAHRTWFQPELRNPDEVWKQKGGSAVEIARLYLALCKAAGLDAYGLAVAARDRGIFDPNFLSLEQLDSLLVVIRMDGKETYLDPGEKLCPFGQVAWNHTLAGGISQLSKDFIHTPATSVKDAVTIRTADLTVDLAGTLMGTVKVLMKGPSALYWRQMSLSTDAPEATKQFTRLFKTLLPAGLHPESIKLKGLLTVDDYLEATANLSGSVSSQTSLRIGLPACLFVGNSLSQFTAKDRTSPVDLRYAEQVIDDVKYHFPANVTLENAPKSAQLAWPEHAALSVTTTAVIGTVDVKHVFARTLVVLDPKDYSSLRDFYGKIAAIDEEQVVFKLPGPTGQ